MKSISQRISDGMHSRAAWIINVMLAMFIFIIGTPLAVFAQEITPDDAIYIIDAGVKIKAQANETYEAENPVAFNLAEVPKQSFERIVYRMSIDEEPFGNYFVVRNMQVDVWPRLNAKIRYRFYVTDDNGQIIRPLQSDNASYEVAFKISEKGAAAHMEFDDYRQKDGMIYARGRMPYLEVVGGRFCKTYVKVGKGGEDEIYEVDSSLSLGFEEGEYSVDVYEKCDDGRIIRSEGFPVSFIYDDVGPTIGKVTIKSSGTSDGKRNDFNIFTNEGVKISAPFTDELSGVETVCIRVGEKIYKKSSIVIDEGQVRDISVWSIDKCGNKSNVSVIRQNILVEKEKPVIDISPLPGEGYVIVGVRDAGSGVGEVNITYNGDEVVNEECASNHTRYETRSYRIELPEGSSGELSVRAYDCCRNEAVLTREINMPQHKDRSAVVTGEDEYEYESDDADVIPPEISNLDTIDGNTFKEFTLENRLGDILSADAATYRLYIDGADISESYVESRPGEHILVIRAMDAAGNESSASASFYIEDEEGDKREENAASESADRAGQNEIVIKPAPKQPDIRGRVNEESDDSLEGDKGLRILIYAIIGGVALALVVFAAVILVLRRREEKKGS